MDATASELTAQPQPQLQPQPEPGRTVEDAHVRLLYDALSASDAAHREAEVDNARLRAALAAACERLAQLAAAPACDGRVETRRTPAPALLNGATVFGSERAPPSAVGAAEVGIASDIVNDTLGRGEAEDQENLAHMELRRRAHALGLGGSALFPKRSSGDASCVAARAPARPQLSG
jgi:hypothetical protein